MNSNGEEDWVSKRSEVEGADGCFYEEESGGNGVRWQAGERGERGIGSGWSYNGRMSSFFSLQWKCFWERRGRCHSGGNGLDGLFGSRKLRGSLKNVGMSVFVRA